MICECPGDLFKFDGVERARLRVHVTRRGIGKDRTKAHNKKKVKILLLQTDYLLLVLVVAFDTSSRYMCIQAP